MFGAFSTCAWARRPLGPWPIAAQVRSQEIVDGGRGTPYERRSNRAGARVVMRGVLLPEVMLNVARDGPA